MVSSFLNSVNSALKVMGLLLNSVAIYPDEYYKVKIVSHCLKNLRTFVLCARKLGNVVLLRSFANNNMDASQESLLLRSEDVVARKVEEIHTLCLDLSPETEIRWLIETKDIISLEEEIEDWYINMSDYRGQSSSLTISEVVEIFDSILDNIVDFLSFRSIASQIEILVKPMDALREQMAFLKNLTCFAALTSTEHSQMEELLTHSEAMALNAAHLCFMCRVRELDEEWWKRMQLKISIQLQNIKPVSPQVYQTYVQALGTPNLFATPNEGLDYDTNIMKNFLDSLISNLWETLQLDNCRVVGMKDPLKELYEGLRFLRTVLKKKASNLDEITRDHIGVVVRSAGVLVCSLFQTHEEIDAGVRDLLERIKVIQAEAGDDFLQTSMLNFPRTNELAFLDGLLEKLIELSSFDAEPITKSYVQTLHDELANLRSFLGETVGLHNGQKRVQTLWNRVLEMAHRAEFLVVRFGVGDVSDSTSMSFYSIIEDIKNISTDAFKVFQGETLDIQVGSKTRKSSHVPPEQPILSGANEVVGFHDEATSMIDRLTRGSKRLLIIGIIGMPGQGKTTLAGKVYNDPFVTCHFHVRAWCTVSQVLDKRRVLLELLNHIDPDRCSELTEQDIMEKLWRRLKGKRYLIFLDDIWTLEAWNSLQGSFPDDSVGSRIIVTSRIWDVIPYYMVDEEPHFLRQFTHSESWELLQRKLFTGKGWPPELHELGMQIAESCKGLPLTIVIVAGLLAATKPVAWGKILDGLSSGGVSSAEQCVNTLDLSYKHLPDYLKPCFLYFGAFPEDQEVSVKRLIRLWIAEGFVRGTKFRNPEDAAEDCMMSLIGRSLVMVAKQRSLGGIKTCRVHDLIHDFCLRKATEEHFFHLLKGYDQLLDFNEPCNLWRLCIYAEPERFKESKLYCPRSHSLLFFLFEETARYRESWVDISFVIHIFKLLRVLDLEQIHVGSVFPSEIELLAQLRYLAIRGEIKVIPSSIGNLSNLETFILDTETYMASLPDTLWNLHKLKFLYFGSFYLLSGGSLPFENLDKSSVLYELDCLSGAIFYSWGTMEKQIRKFPNIRRLKCKLFQHFDDTENFDKIIVPDFLSRLESLNIGYIGFGDVKILEFALPANLRKLTLSDFWLSWSAISSIGKLPNLEVLKLVEGSLSGKTWDMQEGEFSKLRVLALASLDIVSWTASDDQFICFQKLILFGCKYLRELPSCLEYIPTLEMIEVTNCSDATASLVRHIEDEQLNLGNSVLKINIM